MHVQYRLYINKKESNKKWDVKLSVHYTHSSKKFAMPYIKTTIQYITLHIWNCTSAKTRQDKSVLSWLSWAVQLKIELNLNWNWIEIELHEIRAASRERELEHMYCNATAMRVIVIVIVIVFVIVIGRNACDAIERSDCFWSAGNCTRHALYHSHCDTGIPNMNTVLVMRLQAGVKHSHIYSIFESGLLRVMYM